MMPYLSEKKIIAGTDHDRRIKLSEQDKRDIRTAYESGVVSIHGLSSRYGVSRRTIQFILFPERQERNLELRSDRGGSQVYYDKDKHRDYIKRHRRYKQQLSVVGII